MDNLARDVREAERLGYGCHYGRYKVDYPHTADHFVDLPPPRFPLRKCAECGAEFFPKRVNQTYCTEACKDTSAQRRYYLKRDSLDLPLGQAVCPICGGTFDRCKRTQQFCGRSCAATGRNLKRGRQKRETNSAG